MVKRRNTQIQEHIRAMLQNATEALSHVDIETRLDVPADRATIFRVMNRLVEDGFAHKIMSDDGKSYFAACHNGCEHGHHNDEHSHFRCVQCNRLQCLEDRIKPVLPDNYSLLHANIVLTGVCPQCR